MRGTGTLQTILIAPVKGAPLISLPEVKAVAGHGLWGDRHFSRRAASGVDNHITLIESEKIADFVRTTRLAFSAEDARRNLVTQGIDLNPLLDREFYIGTVKVKALELCEPCSLLAKRTHRQILWGLLHRGGLRCRIITDGILRIGDIVGLNPQ